jgi:hypothetical protein
LRQQRAAFHFATIVPSASTKYLMLDIPFVCLAVQTMRRAARARGATLASGTRAPRGARVRQQTQERALARRRA